jgi:sugar lactone lactonase YvrE
MRRRATAAVLAATLAVLTSVVGAAVAEAKDVGYDLPENGVFLEGIGLDQATQTIYVSATNRDGTIYRGHVGDERLEVWQGPRAGDNGRGIDVDGAGRVIVAGGPSSEVRVFSRDGTLLAELPTGETGSFLNDLRIGPDGAAYVTDSSLPRIWRVSVDVGGTWRIERWLDVSGTITYTPSLTDFDLGGIVIAGDGRYLVTAQGTTGQLWRIDLASKAITPITIGGPAVVNADGLVLHSHDLYVVQNFSRVITKLRLGKDARTAQTEQTITTPADRTFTTAKEVGGDLLVVDSKFGFPAEQATAADRVVTLQRF